MVQALRAVDASGLLQQGLAAGLLLSQAEGFAAKLSSACSAYAHHSVRVRFTYFLPSSGLYALPEQTVAVAHHSM